MTENDHATDRPLTEGADAHGIREGSGYRCPVATAHECLCPQRAYHPGGVCSCLACSITRLNRFEWMATDSEEPELYLPSIDRIQRQVLRAQDHVAHAQRVIADREAHRRNREKMHKGAWAFTLTYSPTQHQWSKEEAQTAMRTAIARLRHYYRNEIVEFEAVGEYTQSGAPHVHGHYRLTDGKRMTTKNFRRAYPIWNPKRKCGRGHEGGYHEPAHRDSDYAGYIQKDIDAAWLMETHHVAAQEAHVHQEAEDGTASTDGSASPPDSPTQPDDR